MIKHILPLMVFTLAIGVSSAQAQTMREKKIKEEMFKRIEVLQTKIESIRTDLKKENVVDSCRKLNEMYEIYRKHVDAIGVHMDPYDDQCSEIRNDALTELFMINGEIETCKEGKDNEYVDPKELSVNLKDISRSLKNQEKVIKKKKASFNNIFLYDLK
jgi:hypothetical protein